MTPRRAEAAELLSDHSVPYDGHSLPDYLTGETVPADPNDPSVKAAAVARELRIALYAGEYEAGSKFPSRKVLADDYKSTEGTMNRALQMLAREGLISMGSGRDTTVRRLRPYLVRVTMPGPADADLEPHREALWAAEQNEPAASDADINRNGRTWVWAVSVRAADAGVASMIGLRMARYSGAPEPCDWSAASISAEASR